MNPIITRFIPIDQFTWWLYYYKSALFLSYLFANILINFSKKKDLHFCHVQSHILSTPQGGGGGVIWYFQVYVGSGHSLGFKILNFIIFGGFQKN